MNIEKYKTWKSRHDKTGFVNYQGFQDSDKNRVILFDSAEDLITCFKKNMTQYGGSGIWTDAEHVQTDESVKDPWRFGDDFPTLKDTNKALNEGAAALKYMALVDQKKDELFSEVPKLRELSEIGTTKRRRRIFSDYGEEIDMDRY